MVRFVHGSAVLLTAGIVLAGCTPAEDPRPNVLWVVWDTARADHMSLHGYGRPTTPHLDEWAKGARVFDNALSTAGYTLPSHASMFTGLLPSEHCTNNEQQLLGDSYDTLAELLQGVGYRTYLYSANPHISTHANFDQGFDLVEHPWSPRFEERAVELVRAKLPEEDRSSELRQKFDDVEQGRGGLTQWHIKAAGEIAGDALLDWLKDGEAHRPYFAFLNYMEAHRPYIPQRKHREEIMSAEDVDRSYEVDRSWRTMWEYTFRLRDYSEEEIRLTQATYDACLAELDELFRDLLASLEAQGYLDNTIVVLTSDHGEHLGEQHMLDHQYSVYQPVLRVPLVLHFPPRVEAGRDSRPVVTFDLFPTILELTGTDAPLDGRSKAISLLEPAENRTRLAEEPSASMVGIGAVMREHPKWDPLPWQRRLYAWFDGRHKLIVGSDGWTELYDVEADPLEAHNLRDDETPLAGEMQQELDAFQATLEECRSEDAERGPLSPEELERLKSLGYMN